MISMSERHSPGASCACQCHCSSGWSSRGRTFLFHEQGGRQLEQPRLDLGRIDVVVLAVVLPEPGGLGLERFHHHDELILEKLPSSWRGSGTTAGG